MQKVYEHFHYLLQSKDVFNEELLTVTCAEKSSASLIMSKNFLVSVATGKITIIYNQASVLSLSSVKKAIFFSSFKKSSTHTMCAKGFSELPHPYGKIA